MVVVKIAEGKLKGSETLSVSGLKHYEFLSVPYAKPPVGDLRFKSPQPPESWEGERDATKSDKINVSYQYNFMTGDSFGSEDCLYLNVFTPKLPTPSSKPLPVMVYIHGGGFLYGHGIIKEESRPDHLLDNDVVVVTINYRLGFLGFLCLDIPEAAGNMGLKDQVKALEWVQHNIDQFGGDKNNVTIFGLSAGSASVEYLLLSPSAKGLFHKAIMQSGSSLNNWAINYRYKEITSDLVQVLGYKGDVDDVHAIYEFLLQVPVLALAKTVYEVTEAFPVKFLFFGFVPVIEKESDDAFLTESPYRLLKEGRINKVPVLRGFVNKEGFIMNLLKQNEVKDLMEKNNFIDYLSYDLGNDKEKYNSTFCSLYQAQPQDEDSDKFVTDFFGDLHFAAGIWLAAKLLASNKVPTYVYQFVYDGKINGLKTLFGVTNKGAVHGDELPYLLGSDLIQIQPDENDTLMRIKMTKFWTNFAKNSEPSIPDLGIEWPKFEENSKRYLVINNETSVASDYEPQKMSAFEEVYEKFEK